MPDDDTQEEASLPVTTWIDRLGGAHGSPGGGAACAVMVALSSALLSMVAGYAAADPESARSLRSLDEVRREALDASEEDSRRSGELGAALRDKGADHDPVPDAALTAARSAVALGDLAVTLIPHLEHLIDTAKRFLMPDLVVAAESAAAALGGVSATVRADLRLGEAHGAAPEALAEVDAGVARVEAARLRIDRLRADAADRV